MHGAETINITYLMIALSIGRPSLEFSGTLIKARSRLLMTSRQSGGHEIGMTGVFHSINKNWTYPLMPRYIKAVPQIFSLTATAFSIRLAHTTQQQPPQCSDRLLSDWLPQLPLLVPSL